MLGIVRARFSVRLGFAAWLLGFPLVVAAQAAPLICQPSRGHDGRYWSYRLIEGKACWYPGARGFPKNRLQWHVAMPLEPFRRRIIAPPPAIPPKAETSAAEPLITIIPVRVWPAATFADRWGAWMRTPPKLSTP